MRTFASGGDRGDIVASLPTIRALGGGILMIQAVNYTRVRLTPDKWHGLDLLIKQQPYIQDVIEWKGWRVDYDLNRFRTVMVRALKNGQGRDTNLADWHLEAFGLPRTERDRPWLTVDPVRAARVVINRTGAGHPPHLLYHNYRFPWRKVVEKYGADAVFIGTEPEHQEFCDTHGTVPYHKTENLLEAARVIAGSDLFVGNQSCPLWIAYGLFKRAVVEVWLNGPNSSFIRNNVTLGIDGKVELPDL